MTKANECTCPSGDGSLRHPCPAHPASVELAGVAANLTFINGRPAMCGCQVEYSSGGGEYSDVIYVTLCAKHSGSAILDLVATNRIALTPEYEGQWHADLYLDREIPLAKAEGATPAEAVLALMSAERIDPEQESVEQAGGDERDLQGAQGERECGHAACKSLGEHHPFCKFVSDQDRAALAQPSPASDLDPFNLAPHAEAFNEAPDESLRPEQAEAERPVVIARLYRSNDLTMTPFAEVQKPLPMPRSDGTLTVEPLMTVAQHERIVGARWNRAMDLMGEHVARISEKFKAERDAALARVAELEMLLRKLSANGLMQFSTVDEEMAVQAALGGAPVAQAQHSVPGIAESVSECMALAQTVFARMEGLMPRGKKLPEKHVARRLLAELETLAKLAAAPGKEVPQAWIDVQEERRRQITAEGWTPEHDDEHDNGEMARAAACYALAGSSAPNDGTAALLVSLAWPWDQQWWKPTSARRDLVKACALALAEIERLDRAAATQGGPSDA